ncbi:Pyruvate carboxyltransferase [Senna tora]|uniref:Pyruvate carboxyltransferase n=1 Tax=Senna tora TaxID=362788 RepID=A0A834X0B4_9FABA|nr:Pyruvate carboxyltransferase [Senna tora]
MANTPPIREMSWPESNTRSSPLTASFTSDSSSAVEPDFTIPRQGPRIVVPPEIIREQIEFWQKCLIGVIYDEGPVKEERMEASIKEYWLLQDRVKVVGRKKNIFMFEFNNPFDRNFMAEEGPWAVQNKLLVLDHWQPNIILDEYRVAAFPIWIEFWGFPLEYYSSSVAEQVGRMAGEVLQVDFSDQGFRNLRICKQCGCIGHLARDCKKSRREVQEAVDEQKERIRDEFGFQCFIDYEYALFVHEAVAFRMRNSRRTTMVRIKKEGEEVKYVTSEFKPIAYLRTRTSSSSDAGATNIIRVSDVSISDSDSSSDTPQTQSEPSQNQPHPQSHMDDDNFVDIMNIDSEPTDVQNQQPTQGVELQFLNDQYQQYDLNSVPLGVQIINCQEPMNLLNAPNVFPLSDTPNFSFIPPDNAAHPTLSSLPDSTPHVNFDLTLDLLLCTEAPETFGFMQTPPVMQVAQNELPSEEDVLADDIHVPSDDEEYSPFFLTQFFKTFTSVRGLGFIWDDIIDQLLKLRPNIQAQFANSFASWASTSANSTNTDSLLGWVTKFLKPNVGVGLIVDSNGPEQRWDLFQTAFDVTPFIISFHKSLVFIPASSGPFLACPLNWFYAYRMYTYLTEKWALFSTINMLSFYEIFDVFTPKSNPAKRKVAESVTSTSKKQKTYGTVLGKFQLIQARPMLKYPFQKRARFVMELDPIDEGSEEAVPHQPPPQA